MIEYVAGLVSEKAEEVAHQEIKKYVMEHLDLEIPQEVREETITCAISQLTFSLNRFKALPDSTEDEVKDQFEAWFASNEEMDLRKACHHCLDREMAKRKKEEDPNMSFLDRFRMEHRRR